MKHLKWTMSTSDNSISGVCRSVVDVHKLLQHLTQTQVPELFVVIEGTVMEKEQAIEYAHEVVQQEQAQFETKHRAIHVKTGVCGLPANTKKVWVKR